MSEETHETTKETETETVKTPDPVEPDRTTEKTVTTEEKKVEEFGGR